MREYANNVIKSSAPNNNEIINKCRWVSDIFFCRGKEERCTNVNSIGPFEKACSGWMRRQENLGSGYKNRLILKNKK